MAASLVGRLELSRLCFQGKDPNLGSGVEVVGHWEPVERPFVLVIRGCEGGCGAELTDAHGLGDDVGASYGSARTGQTVHCHDQQPLAAHRPCDRGWRRSSSSSAPSANTATGSSPHSSLGSTTGRTEGLNRKGARVDQPRLRVPLRQSGRGDDHAVLRTSPVASPARQMITSLTDTQYKKPPFGQSRRALSPCHRARYVEACAGSHPAMPATTASDPVRQQSCCLA